VVDAPVGGARVGEGAGVGVEVGGARVGIACGSSAIAVGVAVDVGAAAGWPQPLSSKVSAMLVNNDCFFIATLLGLRFCLTLEGPSLDSMYRNLVQISGTMHINNVPGLKKAVMDL
jgi:hypothetical protein